MAIAGIDKKLLESESLFKAVIDTAVEAIITINAIGSVEVFNQAASRMFGYAPDEVRGQNIKMLMPNPYHDEHDGYLQRYLQTAEKRIIGIGREVQGRHKDGKIFPIFLSVSEVEHQSQRMFVGLIRNLSAQKNTEKQVSSARDQLARYDRINMLNEMAAGIAHEINQPLTAISMYAQGLLRLQEAGRLSEDRLQQTLTKLNEQSQRAGAVIERMQNMTQQGSSKHDVISCQKLLKDVVRLAETEAQFYNIKIILQLSEPEINIFCDIVQIQQVVLNLLRNAMQEMQRINYLHGKQIIVSADRKDERVKVSIIDQGNGIDPNISEQLFEAFQSTKELGSGIGLAICKSIIEAHDGIIGYYPNPEFGTCFYFELPIFQDEV